MKKVGLFIDTWYPMVDGVIKVVDNYARRLTRYCDVVVFCPETRGYSKEEDEKLPYRVVRCHSLPIIGYDYDLPTPVLDPVFEAQILRSGIDIVHIHSPFSVGMAGVLYAKLHKIPAVATLHSQYRQDFEKPLHTDVAVNVAMSGIMRVFNACDECWAVNAGIKDLYEADYGLIAPCKVRLNATDHRPVEDPQEAARIVNETFGVPADATVFLFVGRINFIKNIDFTLRALARAKELGLRNFRMLFAGRGQDEEKLAALVKALGLQEEVIMCGLTDKPMLERLYSRAKLFLFPSLYDANSLVQIEAACQGTPTLFLEGARTAATVTPGVNGYISAPGEENYARAILDILADEPGYASVSAAARRDLYLNWDDVVRDVYADYCALCGEGPAPERVDRMGLLYRRLREQVTQAQSALEGISGDLDGIKELEEYLDSGLWLKDFEADERGDLPRDIHRDALTEDAVYNLLEDIRDLRTLMNRFVHATARRRK